MNGDSEDQDLGEPIAQLVQLVEEPRQGFLERVRSSIERRRLGSHMSGLAWHGLSVVAIELLAMLMALFRRAEEPSGDANDRPPTA